MKLLRVVGIILAVLIMGLLLYGLYLPTEYEYKQEQTIDAPKELIYQHILFLKHHENWSPWLERDPDMQMSYQGEDGTVGAKTSWVSSTEGVGEREITAIQMNQRLETELRFKEPFDGGADNVFELKDTDDGVKVSWAFSGSNAYPMNAIFALFGAEQEILTDYDRGLEMLKEICEKQAKQTIDGHYIKERKREVSYYIGIREGVKAEDIQAFYEANLGKIYTALQQKGVEMTGMPCGIHFGWTMLLRK